MLLGRRDEGILLLVAYHVCHEAHDNPGPFTAYQQQYTAMRQAGHAKPNPRKQILDDMSKLINDKRRLGFRPIVMMDANGDYRAEDKDLASFISAAGLADPFYDKFNFSPPTYVYGKKRLDYILVDQALTPAIERIGYLGTHDGAISDHVMAVVDFDEQELFAGVLNRPPKRHARDILIEQADKIKDFLDLLHRRLDEHSIQNRTFTLAEDFVTYGATKSTLENYHALYNEFLEIAGGTVATVGRKKFGYMRSSELTVKGQMVNAYKKLLDCRIRGAPPSPALERYCTTLDLDASFILTTNTTKALQRTLRAHRHELWQCQKEGEDLRQEWLASVARDRARALDDPDWERKLNQMRHTARDSAVNRKLGAITKGRRGVLDRIQIPTHDWFFSPSKQELYHYDRGVFEAYPSTGQDTFFPHHTLKVLASDVALVKVALDEANYWTITETLPTPQSYWRDITSQEQIEHHLLERNKRHLEQTAREGGISTKPPLTHLRLNNGYNALADKITAGLSLTEYELTPEMAAFFAALQRTPTEHALPPILGEITSADIQSMFRHARERTSSDSRTLNYTLWKCMATDDSIAGILSVLFSLPFMYGFVNMHWTSMTDFMLEKKPGVRQIHTLRIIGKVAAEFNTCLKFFIGK